MDTNDFWERVDKALKVKHKHLSDLAVEVGLHRGSLYRQRERGITPRFEVVLDIEEFLGVRLYHSGEFGKWDEYIDALSKAEDWQLKSVRNILGLDEKILDSTTMVS